MDKLDLDLLRRVADADEGITAPVGHGDGPKLLALEFFELVRSEAEPERRGVDRWFITDKGREKLND